MASLSLNINSTPVQGVLGIVNIKFNGNFISEEQLTENFQQYTFEVDVLPGNNVIQIDLINDQAVDANNNGDYSDPEDETMKVTVTDINIVNENETIVVLPKTDTVTDDDGNPQEVTISEFFVWGMDYSIEFVV